MRTRVVSIIAVISVLLASFSIVATHAQSVSTPLIVAIGGNPGSMYDADLWKWTEDGPLKQLTHDGHNGNPALSLDGRYVAYLSLPDQMLSYLISLNWVLAGVYSANVMILDLATGTSTRIASQLSDYDPHHELGITRSNPVWSPDSQFVAWTEYNNHDEQLMVYSLNSHQTQVFSTEPQLDVYPAQPIWSNGGLTLLLVDKKDPNFYIRTFDATGKILFDVPSTFSDIDSLRWVKDGNKDYLRMADSYNENPAATFIDPLNGEQSPHSEPIELYSLGTPNGLSLLQACNCIPDHPGFPWLIKVPGSADVPIDTLGNIGPDTSDGTDQSGTYIAIAPDGQQVAYLKFQNGAHDQFELWIYGLGQSQMVALPTTTSKVEAVTWGAVGWRVHRN